MRRLRTLNVQLGKEKGMYSLFIICVQHLNVTK